MFAELLRWLLLAAATAHPAAAPKPPPAPVAITAAATTPQPVSTLPRTTLPPRPVPTTATTPKTTLAPRPAPTTPPPPPRAVAAAQPAPCAVALAYLAAHAAPGFAHYCRPGLVTLSNGVVAHSFTCYPGTLARCPDGGPEIVITDPGCVAAYEDEASNSFWNFAQTSGYIGPGAVQNGRVWDPFGECVA